jgi:hypothetical protein
MTLARSFFARNRQITRDQRNAASQIWKRIIEPAITPPANKIESVREEVRTLLNQKNPKWPDDFEKEINRQIFDHRDQPDLTLSSEIYPTGILRVAVENCKIPFAVIPPNVSMSFTPNNNIQINNVQYNAKQVLGMFATAKIGVVDNQEMNLLDRSIFQIS